eukprot:tig00001229_g7840.t1
MRGSSVPASPSICCSRSRLHIRAEAGVPSVATTGGARAQSGSKAGVSFEASNSSNAAGVAEPAVPQSSSNSGASESSSGKPCMVCLSRGYIRCLFCREQGTVRVGPEDGRDTVTCPQCLGDGRETCRRCSGTGIRNNQDWLAEFRLKRKS